MDACACGSASRPEDPQARALVRLLELPSHRVCATSELRVASGSVRFNSVPIAEGFVRAMQLAPSAPNMP